MCINIVLLSQIELEQPAYLCLLSVFINMYSYDMYGLHVHSEHTGTESLAAGGTMAEHSRGPLPQTTVTM